MKFMVKQNDEILAIVNTYDEALRYKTERVRQLAEVVIGPQNEQNEEHPIYDLTPAEEARYPTFKERLYLWFAKEVKITLRGTNNDAVQCLLEQDRMNEDLPY